MKQYSSVKNAVRNGMCTDGNFEIVQNIMKDYLAVSSVSVSCLVHMDMCMYQGTYIAVPSEDWL